MEITFTQHATPSGINRVLIVDAVPSALAQIFPSNGDFVLSWQLEPMMSTDTSSLLDEWLKNAPPLINAESIIGGKLHSTTMNSPSGQQVLNWVDRHRTTSGPGPAILLLAAGQEKALELDFRRAKPAQCALIAREASLPFLVPFFRKYHANATVRRDADASLAAFSDVGMRPDALNLLDPIKVTS